VFRWDPKKSVSAGQLSVSVAGCQQERVRLSVVSRSCSFSWSRFVVVVVVVLGLRTGAVYEDEGAMNGESQWREFRHHYRLIWKASLNDENRTQAGSLGPEGAKGLSPGFQPWENLKINSSPWARRDGRFPGLKPWAESYRTF
jgi:hypothetical protein